MRKFLFAGLLIFTLINSSKAQYTTLNAHSHNDYGQKTPFYLAYNAHFGSIEADILAVKGALLVAHDSSSVIPARTLESLYLHPIVTEFRNNGGKAWNDNSATFQFMIDLKTAAEPTLAFLVNELKKYPGVFDPKINENAIRIVITGNRPAPSEFKKYPQWISFDGDVARKYDPEQLKRIALYSENMANYTSWKGRTPLSETDESRLKQVIDSVHKLNKKIRFWNSPDTAYAWRTLMRLKVDYLNTDHIEDLATYLENYKPVVK